MTKRFWLGGLVVGASLGAAGCGGASVLVGDAGSGDLGGNADTGATDVGATDAGTPDTGATDTGAADAGNADTGATDAGNADTGATDAGTSDAVAVDAGSPDTGVTDAGTPFVARTTPTNGSAVVLTADDAITVAANRTANSISVFANALAAATPGATRTIEIPTADGQPWAAVIGNDDNTAYVILRHAQQLVRVSNLRTTPAISGTLSVGSEPTGIAISPSGAHVYVANWADGTVTDVDVGGATMSLARTINLNPVLAGTGALGPTVTSATTRPGLAHPRALVVTSNTNDANDGDETVYVTEFFAQQTAAGDALPGTTDARLDVDHRGIVYRFNAGTGVTGEAISLAPFAATGFGASGCFPNQLYAAAIAQNRLYVTAVCESPRRPVDAQQNVFSAIFVVNATDGTPSAANTVLLTRKYQDRYDGPTPATPVVADTNARRFPLIPNDIAFIHGGSVAYVSSYGSDAVFRVAFAADGTFTQVGNGTTQHFIDLTVPAAGTAAAIPGRLPIGVAVSNTGAARAVALNENTRNLSLIDLSVQATAAAVVSSAAPTVAADVSANTGRRFFVTGLARWSRNGQGWGSCEGCHPDGLTDNVTWTFAAGPRQTISLDGTFDSAGVNQRILNWTGILDEVHDFENNTRGTSGGVGAIVRQANNGATPPVVSNDDRIIFDGTATTGGQVATATPQAGLNGSTRSMMPGALGSNALRSTQDDWENIDLYVRTIRPPRAPTTLVAADVAAGQAIFTTNHCDGCHGSLGTSNSWTISRRFYDPTDAHNAAAGTLRTQTYTGFATAFAAINPASNGHAATFRILGADVTAQGAGGGDQISCVLRAVGTLTGTTTAPVAVVPSGVALFENRNTAAAADLGTLGAAAQGVTGFNPPSLVGMGTGAPFFHGGNARTLEELLTATFAAHYQAFAANFLDPSLPADTRATQIRQLVAFLSSIDDTTTPIALPATITGIGSPNLCAGFTP